MLRDELARVQGRSASYTAVRISLEAELSRTKSTLSEVRGAVADNRSLGKTITPAKQDIFRCCDGPRLLFVLTLNTLNMASFFLCRSPPRTTCSALLLPLLPPVLRHVSGPCSECP